MSGQVSARTSGEFVGNHVSASGCLEVQTTSVRALLWESGAAQDKILVRGGGVVDGFVDHNASVGDIEVLVDEVDGKGLSNSMSGNNAEKNSMGSGVVGCGVMHIVDMRKLVVCGRREGRLPEASIVEGRGR